MKMKLVIALALALVVPACGGSSTTPSPVTLPNTPTPITAPANATMIASFPTHGIPAQDPAKPYSGAFGIGIPMQPVDGTLQIFLAPVVNPAVQVTAVINILRLESDGTHLDNFPQQNILLKDTGSVSYKFAANTANRIVIFQGVPTAFDASCVVYFTPDK